MPLPLNEPSARREAAIALDERIEIDFDDVAAIEDIVQVIARSRRWWTSSAPAERTYGRKSPDRRPLARMMYSVPGARRPAAVVDVVEHPVGGADTVVVPYRSVWLSIARFGSDPELPGMRVLLERHPEAEVIRYRPGQRCTLRVGDGFAKTFADDRGRQLHDEAVQLWQASQRGEIAAVVAEPLGWDAETASQWQGLVNGQPVIDELETRRGPELAQQLGHALGTLAISSVAPAEVTGRDWQFARSERYLRRIGTLRPDLKAAATELLSDLSEGFAAIAPVRHVVLHGSPHPHQWLYHDPRAAGAANRSQGQVGLVDFDRLAFGEPELDLATFTTEVELGSGDKAVLAAVNAAFIAGYEEVIGPIDLELLRLYEANKRLALAMTAATTLKPGAWSKVSRRLQRAHDMLRG